MFDDRQVSEENQKKLLEYYYNYLSKAVDVGYNPSAELYDPALAHSLKYNIAQFSAFKETSFRKQLEAALVKDGKTLSWAEFKKEADKLHIDYNQRWLKTEYHQTVAKANIAQQWAEFEADADLYPNLKIVTAGDARVRDEHKLLDGLILPIKHPYWKKHTPPFDWGCRCHLLQTDEPASKKIPDFKFKAEHEGNPFYDGTIFNQPVYANGLNLKDVQDVYKKANDFFNKTGKYISNYTSYLKLKKNANYLDVKFSKKTGGLKATHKLHNFDKQTGIFEKSAQNALFKNGNSIILEKELADVGEKVIDGVTHLDGYVDGKALEISVIKGTGNDTVKRALKHANDKNAEVVVLYFTQDTFSMERLIIGIKKYNGLKLKQFKHIIYIVDDVVYYYK